jgi:hypothetical protein
MSHASRPRPAHADCLTAVRDEAFRLLARGVADRRSPFHTPTLATIGADGAPRARTLVLRAFEPAPRVLRLHSDARSAKLGELARNPHCCLHAYDMVAQIQLRLDATATLHAADAFAEAAWTASRPFSRMCYAAPDTPGTPISAPPAAPRDTDGGRANFAVIRLTFDRLEWLWLAAEGHRRARLAWDAAGAMEATWLAP